MTAASWRATMPTRFHSTVNPPGWWGSRSSGSSMDAPYFGAANGSLPAPDLVDKIYRDEFDVAYQEGGLYVLTMHPFYTGHRSRALWLDKLIAYMKSKPGVWFATHEDVAKYVKTTPAGD